MIHAKQTQSPFPWKPFVKKLAALAIPVALQNLLTTTASMVDTMMVAPLGELSVGALGLCAQFSSLMFAGYWGFVGGGMLFFAQYWGSQEDDGIERSYGMTWTCMMTVATIFGSLAVFTPDLIMRIYTDKQAIQQIGVQYLRIVGFAYLMQVFSMAMSSLLRATERVRIPMAASIASVASNIFLNWVFIYSHLGAPAMGIRGAALATTCAAAVNMLAIYLMAHLTGYPYLFRVRGHFRWTRAHLKTFFVKCLPIICNEVLIGTGNWIQNDTYRASGDAVTGTVLEIVFIYAMVLPSILVSGFVLKAPYWVIFLCCYIDEPVRYVLMQLHLYSGRWIRPVTELGKAALPAFRETRSMRK